MKPKSPWEAFPALACFAKAGEKSHDVVARLEGELRRQIAASVRTLSGASITELMDALDADGLTVALSVLQHGAASTETVAPSTFEQFACPLKLCLASVFGVPRIPKQQREYFERRMQEDHFVMGYMMGPGPAGPAGFDALGLYVYNLAVEEMGDFLAHRVRGTGSK